MTAHDTDTPALPAAQFRASRPHVAVPESLDSVLADIEGMDHDWGMDCISDDDGNRVYRSWAYRSGFGMGELEFTRFIALTAAIVLRDAIRASRSTEGPN